LKLNGNRFAGSVPSSFGELKNLGTLKSALCSKLSAIYESV
jgi:hypothetical protein